jgi:hypothetical protein
MNVGIVTGQYHHFCQERNLVKNSYANRQMLQFAHSLFMGL